MGGRGSGMEARPREEEGGKRGPGEGGQASGGGTGGGGKGIGTGSSRANLAITEPLGSTQPKVALLS